MALPEAAQVDALILTNELKAMTMEAAYTERWENVVTEMRALGAKQSGRSRSIEIGVNSGGLLGYGPDQQEMGNVPFAGSLDFIGVSAYPRVTKNLDATYDDFYNGWFSDVKRNENLARTVQNWVNDYGAMGVDVYLTEIGSPATRGGQWYFSDEPTNRNVFDLEQQAAAYRAFIDVLRGIDGLKGIYIYAWSASTSYPRPTDYDAYRWSPNGKPAEDAIRDGFNKG